MITDDEVLRVLERANPASVDDPIPMLDVAVYRDALHTRSATVTLIDSEPEAAVATRDRRWPILVAAVAVAVVAVLALVRGNQPEMVPTATTTAPTPSTELVVRSLDPPIACQPERCPSLASAPGGTLVAYDHTAKTLTWYGTDGDPHVVPVVVDDRQVRLVAVDTRLTVYLLLGSAGADAWDLVMINGWDYDSGEVVDLSAPERVGMSVSSPNVERADGGLVERLCWSGCEPEVRPLTPWPNGDGVPGRYPVLSSTTGGVAVQRGQQRWEIAWPHTLDSRSQVAPRWDGGAVLTLVPESADAATELIELSPDGSIERFGLGHEAVYVLLRDGSAVLEREGQLVRLSPPQPVEPWSPQLTAHALDHPISLVCPPSPYVACPTLAVSREGTLVAYDPVAATLTWYDDEPRVVPITAEGWGNNPSVAALLAIGPHDIAYFSGSDNGRLVFVTIAPTGAVITRVNATAQLEATAQTAAGIVTSPCKPADNRCAIGTEYPQPSARLLIPWVDLDGNPITDPKPYPTARDTDAGVEVRLGERTWLLTEEQLSGYHTPTLIPRTDGGVVALLNETFGGPGQPNKLVELLPDGTVERYVVPSGWVVLPDGSIIIDHNSQLIRLAPPG